MPMNFADYMACDADGKDLRESALSRKRLTTKCEILVIYGMVIEWRKYLLFTLNKIGDFVLIC